MASSSSSSAALVCRSLPSSLVPAWLDHCAACFAEKEPYPTPRSYFEAHLEKDPMKDLNGIAIVECDPLPPSEEDDEKESKESTTPVAPLVPGQKIIASTARVFVRRQYIDGAQVTIGGVGEVCTKPDYRQKGYAELALTRSLAYARKLQLQLTSLHASSDMAPYYAGKGFTSVDRWFGIKSDFESENDVNIVGAGLQHGAFSLRITPLSQFMSPSLLPQFTAMYDSYSSQFNGPVVRSSDYWNTWVQSDISTSIGSKHQFPVEIYTVFEEWDGSDPAPVPASPVRFLAYMFIQRVPCASDDGGANRDRMYVIREYAALPLWTQRADGGRQMFLSLAQYAVRQIRHKFAEVDPEAAARSKITVKFPLPLTHAFTVPLRVDEEVRDPGFMFQTMPVQVATVEETNAPVTATVTEFRGQTLEQTSIVSPFAATPFVLHHESEDRTETSPQELRDKLNMDAKSKVVFWQTDAY